VGSRTGAAKRRLGRAFMGAVVRGSSLAALAMGATMLSLAAPALAAEPGKISGTVTDAATSLPIAGIEVCAYPPNVESIGPETLACQTTNASGEYTLDGLTAGHYIVEFSDPSNSQLNYIAQYYSEQVVESSANLVTVNSSATTSGIDAKLSKGGTIGGTVTDARTGGAIGSITVCAMRAGGGGECSVSAADGTYSILRLSTGSYTVVFSPPFGGRPNYLTQYYDGRPSSFGAESVGVTAGTTIPGIDAALQPGGQITGTVTDVSTGAALAGARICAISQLPEVFECALTDEVGHYLITALPSADYSVRFSAKGYLTEYYNARYKLTEALTVPLFAGELKTGIDAAMSTGPATLPSNTIAPSISGVAQVGDSLSCGPGIWSAKPPPVFAYQWLRDGAAIEGATESSYTPSKGNVGHAIACQVTATNAVGSGTAASAAVTIAHSPHELPLVSILSRRLVARGDSLRMRLGCAHARCTGRISIGIQTGRGKRLRTLALARFSIPAGRRHTIVLPVRGQAGARGLARAAKHPLIAHVGVSVQGGRQVSETVRLV
jgi:hypothetical protein